jgi:hypothetical protein
MVSRLSLRRLDNTTHDDHRQNFNLSGTEDQRNIGEQAPTLITRNVIVVVIVVVVIFGRRRSGRGYISAPKDGG